MHRLTPETSTLVVVDVQEKLAGVMPETQLAELERAGRILLGAARTLGVQTLLTEQYPKGLGPTLKEISDLADAAGAARFEKVSFSPCDVEDFVHSLEGKGARTLIVMGMETHICVFQGVRDLVGRGFKVHVPMDGVASRRDDHRRAGLELCERAGAIVTTSETVAFDWLRRADSAAFKEVSKLVR